MHTPWTPTTSPDSSSLALLDSMRVQGWRAVIDFAPKPTSSERLCAGVVTRSLTGEVAFACALDARKMKHAFGPAGIALHDVALKLCESLASFWGHNPNAELWKPPFSSARLASLDRFSAKDVAEATERMFNRTSTLHTLLSAYDMQLRPSNRGIVERVKSAVQRDVNSRHLAKRFGRELILNGEAQPFKVDFLGQHFACYFLQLTQSARGLEGNIERAYGKLYELQALRRLVKNPKKSLGLLDEERPHMFELLMVGARNDGVQRKAIYQMEALADRNEVVARLEPSVSAAAERLYNQERKAA